MKKILNFLFSMQMMGVLILLFAFSIGTATIIENDFGTAAARSLVYNAWWFELMLLIIVINLIVNIFRYQLFQKEKWSILLFHIAFIVIFIGSAFTRYIGFEGNMHIREGQSSNQMATTDTYVQVRLKDGNQQMNADEKMNLSSIKSVAYDEDLSIENKQVSIHLNNFIPHAKASLVEDPNGTPMMEMVIAGSPGKKGMQNFTMQYNTKQFVGNHLLAFGKNANPDAIVFDYTDSLRLYSPVPITEVSMMGGESIPMESNKWIVVSPRKLYDIDGTKLVIRSFYPSAKFNYVEGKDKNVTNVLVFNVNSGNESQELFVRGRRDYVGVSAKTNINGVNVSIGYGSKLMQLPFSLKLNDFQLDRYPGSHSPSSFASEVTLIDSKEGITKDYRIFMNNVLKYKGFRFFQASYDSDEQGTILSVNHDRWGMIVTYFGYFILMLGMAWSLFNPYTRFKALGKKSKGTKTAVITAFLVIGSMLPSSAQNRNVVPTQQAKQFGEVLVQDNSGRFEPINTLASEVIRKITKKSNFEGYSSEQIFLSMVLNPQEWQRVPMIKVGNSDLAREMGINGKYGSFMNFINQQGQYKLGQKVQEAYAKKPAQRNKYDKEIISVDERINISYMVFTGEFLKIFPDPNDNMKAWYNPTSQIKVHGEDSLFIKKSIILLSQAISKNEFDNANTYITGIKNYQKKYGSAVIPSETKQKVEIFYNNTNIFKRLFPFYLLIGFVLVVFLVIQILKPKFPIKWIMQPAIGILGIAFLFHTAGLAARWYISGHAPWSNGFESMTYVAWACLLAGFIFVRKSYFAIAATSVLAGLTLFVAHLSWMNPEITNLVPVLKSYWLTIHVAIITASYGFLALGAILGMINLVLMILQSDKNKDRIANNIQELSRISEMTMTIGLYFLTIGTFLGGVWANESWGRYWGWDPKETWALVSVLVYSFVLHIRFIPGLKSVFSFNLASVWAYSSILMTYFGVNYYLAGMHSYAKGDPVPVPTWVYYTLAVVIALSLGAYFNYKKYKTNTKEVEA
ncbi:cytochrome c biogenesis protein [Ancylomarina longa]|uniref:Cytochrome C biogenesis protein n=1 Tax=Ancylomarina longa TaxID=2487017 RepID=A0A434AFV7_9BACT|nr:cytochrome c biogenesis protein CcsA [Ancylomarina longa]RUT73260.1 cytochrome C biogenesis protein [Ancylomarina longa]